MARTDRVLIRWSTQLSAKAAAAAPRLATLGSATGREAAFVRFTGSGAAVYDLGAPLGKDAHAVLAAVGEMVGVASVEPDLWMTADVLPDDPYSGLLWGLLGAADGSPYGIDARGAWATTTGTGVVVAVIDTGLVAHEDLSGQVVAGYDMVSVVAISNDGDGRDADASDPGDWSELGDPCAARASSWHGTHVAGTIAALSSNFIGVFGGAPSVKIQPVRVLGTCGGYLADIADGIRWAAGGSVPGVPVNATPARVLNLSLGGSHPTCPIEYSSAIADARSRGSVVVVAAGNATSDASAFSPANCDGVITVGATGDTGKLAWFSNYGSAIEIAGPGESILSTVDSGTTVPSGPTYLYYDGTSMAAPHVALSAALLAAAHPGLTPDGIGVVLEGTATAPAPDASALGCAALGCGAGIVNAGRAITQLADLTPIVGRVTPSVYDPAPNSPLTVAVGAVDLTGIASAHLSIDGGGWTSMSAGDGAYGGTYESLTTTITAPATGGSHTICVRATDLGANTSDGTACAAVTVIAPPPGDDFVSATTITGNSGSINGTNVGATSEAGEPPTSTIDFSNGPNKTVWFRWIAPNAGIATFDLCTNPNYDTLMAVYLGSALGSLTRVTDDDDTFGCGFSLQSKVMFAAASGSTYQIQVDGFVGQTGTFTLTWSLPDSTPPAVIAFAPTTASPTGGTTISYSLTFSEPVTGLAAGDFSISGTSAGWTVNSVTGSGAGPYTVGLTALAPTPGTVDVSLHANGVADSGGNPGPPGDVTAASVTVVPDATGPTGTVSINGGIVATTSAAVSVAVPASDPSGVSQVRLSNDPGMTGAVIRPYATPQSWALAAGADGTRTVYVQWQDGVGNWSSISSDSITLDTTAPAGTVSIDGGNPTATTAVVSIGVPASDVSGVGQVRLSNDPGMAGAVTRTYSTPQSWTLSAGADGGRNVYVQWQDGVGNWSAISSDSITLDMNAPTNSTPAPSLAGAAALAKTTVPVLLAWSGSDSGSGLARFELAQSTNGGPFVPLALASPTATTLSLALSPGGATYRFQVRAVDVAGNTSAWAAGPIFHVRQLQESGAGIRYVGTWSRGSGTAALGGRFRSANRARASATFVFTGSSVLWVAQKGAAMGSARVYVDGVNRGVVNLRASSNVWRQGVFSQTWATSGRHTIKIVNLGTRGHPRINLDAFVVLW